MQAAATTLVAKPEPALYRPRKPQLSDLYQLLEAHYDDVKAHWEDRFEKAYGYWRGFVDNVVLRYFDCGVLCFSCKARNLCPSCDAKRAAAFAAFLQVELLEDVGHAVWSFSIPRRPIGPEDVGENLVLEQLGDPSAALALLHELKDRWSDGKSWLP